MSQTQKISLLGFGLLALFTLATLLPADAHAESRAERLRAQKEARMASSTSERSTTGARASTTKERGSNVDASCMQAAVAVREASLASAWGTFNTAMASAMSTRASGLSSAWGQTETSARNTALKEVWKTWKSDSKNAHAEMKSARKSAWETLKTTAKSSCKVSLPKEESLGKESDGSITL